MTLLLLAVGYVLFLFLGWALLAGGTRRPDPTVPTDSASAAAIGETPSPASPAQGTATNP